MKAGVTGWLKVPVAKCRRRMMLEPGRFGGSAQALVVRHMATDDVLSCLRPEVSQWLFPAGLVVTALT
jgi:hypothetical protein